MAVTETIDNTGHPTDASLQIAADGRLRHLLTLRDLDRQIITGLFDQAETFLGEPGQPGTRRGTLRGKTVANLFFEPSTRTRASFELAAKRLGADVLNLDVNKSSQQKGESVLDMVCNLQAMQVDVFVLRTAETGVPALVARHVAGHVSVLSAGESHVSHPTQGLLDAFTIRRRLGRIAGLTIAIVGDVAHSRVARSAAEVLLNMDAAEVRLVSPESLAPEPGTVPPGARILHDIEEGLRGADVVMALRIQKERIANPDGIPGTAQYFADYGVTCERMKLAAKNAIVMHPGPLNRGVEIESRLVDGPQSAIVEQVRNGVAVRMAVLSAVCRSSS